MELRGFLRTEDVTGYAGVFLRQMDEAGQQVSADRRGIRVVFEDRGQLEFICQSSRQAKSIQTGHVWRFHPHETTKDAVGRLMTGSVA